MHRLSRLITFIAFSHPIIAQILPESAPKTWQEGQAGTNQCGTQSSQNSTCQNIYINSVSDFCLWGPPQPGPNSDIGHSERVEVAWCLQEGYGTRVIPPGAIKGAHFIQTPDFVQVTGTGNLSMINIPANDTGGELDPHGADGNGNPVGGLVFSSAFGKLQQVTEWTMFLSGDIFCFRACKPGPNAARWCQHIYDVMGCAWNMPGDYKPGFDTCKADSGEPAGEYNGVTFYQGQAQTPTAHPRPSQSACGTVSAIGAPSTETARPNKGLATSGAMVSIRVSGSTPTNNAVVASSRPFSNTSGAGEKLMRGWEYAMFIFGPILGISFGAIFVL